MCGTGRAAPRGSSLGPSPSSSLPWHSLHRGASWIWDKIAELMISCIRVQHNAALSLLLKKQQVFRDSSAKFSTGRIAARARRVLERRQARAGGGPEPRADRIVHGAAGAVGVAVWVGEARRHHRQREPPVAVAVPACV